MRTIIISAVTIWVMLSSAQACTVCDSGTGVAVRAGISEDFWATLGMVMAPFLGTFVVLAAAYFVIPKLFGSTNGRNSQP